MCLTLVCIPIAWHKGLQSPVPSSSSIGPPCCGTAQAASVLNHLSTARVQTIPPTTSSSTRAVLSYHATLNSVLVQSLPKWCVGVSRGDSGWLRPCRWPEHLDVGSPREGDPAPAHLGLHFCQVTPVRVQQ